MHRLLSGLACTLLVAPLIPLSAQAANDETQIRSLATKWEQAWNRHDMKGLAALLSVDADFVNVAGRHWKGREEIERQHADRLGQFKESVWTTKAVNVQFIRSDIALVHVDWGLRGDTDPDGTARKPRDGVFTWLVLKHEGKWEIRAVQNTNINNPPIISK